MAKKIYYQVTKNNSPFINAPKFRTKRTANKWAKITMKKRFKAGLSKTKTFRIRKRKK